MKIRNGFVSNSSSSSFVVAFDREIKDDDETVKYLIDLLYEGRESEAHDGWQSIEYFSTRQLCQIIARDLTPVMTSPSQRKVNFDALIQTFMNDGYDAAFALYNIKIDDELDRIKDWNYDSEEDDEVRKLAEQNPGKYIYKCEFSDNDGALYSHLEHGDTFRAVPHARISHH